MTGFTLVTATKIQDASGRLLANGRVIFFPVNNFGKPISAIAGGGGGLITQSGVVFLVVAGAITTDLFAGTPQIADTTLTTPANICYRISVTDATGAEVQGPGYGLQQPSGTTFNLDTALPNQPMNATVQTGPPGLSGASFALTLTFVSAGSQTVAHGLNTLTPLIQANVASGATRWWAVAVNANNTRIFALGPMVAAFAFLGGIAIVPTADITTGLAAYWPMNEGAGQSVTDTVSSVVLTTPGGSGLTWAGSPLRATFAAGSAPGSAVQAASSSVFASLFAAAAPWSISFWLNPASISGIPSTILASTLFPNTGIWVYTGSDLSGALRLALINTGSTNAIFVDSPAASIVVSARNHYVITYDGSSHAAGVSMYVNGVVVSTTTPIDNLTASTTPSGVPLTVMATPGLSGDAAVYFGISGTMDNLRFYTRALAAIDAALIHTGGN